LAARAFKLAISLVRHSGLLPKAIPDGRGDERVLARAALGAEVIVFFADTESGLYQLRPWYPALRALHRSHRLMIVGTDSRTIRTIRRESRLPAYTISHYSSIDLILANNPVRLVLYVNHNAANFSVLAFPQLVHVSIMHGDSDKVVSISGQTKAYDFTFVAGQAAIDRLAAHLPLFNAAEKCLIIGRPQVERRAIEPKPAGPPAGLVAGNPSSSGPAGPGRSAVLYAPTWEGGTDSAAYSSLEAYGERIVQAIVRQPRLTLLYRPHPLTGSRLPGFAEADSRIRRMISDAAKADRTAGHRLMAGGDPMTALEAADLLISDISSLAIDFLVTGRPLVVTVPPSPKAVVAPTPLLDLSPRLGESELGRLGDFLTEQIESDPAAAARAELAEYYLGDTRPGAATKAFIDACGQMIELAEANQLEFGQGPGQGAGAGK
jgi:hypothetical protein